jgi:hypothetical protein
MGFESPHSSTPVLHHSILKEGLWRQDIVQIT